MRARANVISVSGFARAGKDTIAEILSRRYGYRIRGYADKLKELAIAINLWDGREESKRTPLVALGAGARNILYPDIWIDAVWRDPQIKKDVRHGLILKDVRYFNELMAARNYTQEAGMGIHADISIWVEREGAIPQGEEAEKTAPLKELADYVIVNDGSVEDLENKLIVIFE